jgi:RNA polymerase sigma factor (TIGR02999 family)
MPLDQSRFTGIHEQWGDRDGGSLNRLIPALYDHLHQMAHQRLRGAHFERSLNTTGLVHEAYLRLAESPDARFLDRTHFLALASRVMRNVLVDHARSRTAEKRGGGRVPAELREDAWLADVDLDAVADLDEALRRLEAINSRQSRIVEQRYFGGLSLEETAAAMGLSLATVKRELRTARAWLATELGGT